MWPCSATYADQLKYVERPTLTFMRANRFAIARMVLRDMGKAGLAIMVLAANSWDSEDSDTSAPTSGWKRANLGFVSAYILYRNGEAALIDTGVYGSEVAIRAALGEIGMTWDSVSHLIITHRHDDHQGSLEGILYRTDEAPWYAGAGDIDAIDADTEGIVVGDGDSVFDLEIIETPGHTPGHISVLDRASKVLISGDAINGADGGVIGANPEFTEDMTLANTSIGKLAGFDFDVVLFGHGEPIESGASEAVGGLAKTLS